MAVFKNVAGYLASKTIQFFVSEPDDMSTCPFSVTPPDLPITAKY